MSETWHVKAPVTLWRINQSENYRGKTKCEGLRNLICLIRDTFSPFEITWMTFIQFSTYTLHILTDTVNRHHVCARSHFSFALAQFGLVVLAHDVEALGILGARYLLVGNSVAAVLLLANHAWKGLHVSAAHASLIYPHLTTTAPCEGDLGRT